MDGDTANFNVTATPYPYVTGYAWSFTVPSGAGNNPQVTFGSPDSASTSASCKWFALPDQDCPPWDSQYTIRCIVTFNDSSTITKETTLTVNAHWIPAGFTDEPLIINGPRAGFDSSQNLYVVISPGN